MLLAEKTLNLSHKANIPRQNTQIQLHVGREKWEMEGELFLWARKKVSSLFFLFTKEQKSGREITYLAYHFSSE